MGAIKNILAKDSKGDWMVLFTTTVDDSTQVIIEKIICEFIV